MELWNLLLDPPAPAPWNMALDEALLRTAAQRGRPLLRVYSWERPAVTFGYFQKFPADLAGKGDVVRRPTGGGIVYHGADTTYTVVVPPGHRLHTLKTGDAYCVLHQAVAAALSLPATLAPEAGPVRGQYECFQNPVAGDVVAEDKKLAGGAQRRGKSGMLHQGSIAVRLDPQRLVAGFRQVLGVEFAPYRVTDDELALAGELARTKYATDEWNHRVR